MQQDQNQHLSQLGRRTAVLAQLTRDLAEAIPAHVEGSDATGRVLVILGRDGMPTQIRVRQGWPQRLVPERLANAVLDANSDAVQRCMRTWTTAVDDDGWWRRRTDLEVNPDAEQPFASRPPPRLPAGQVRDSNDLAEEVLGRLHDAQSAPVKPLSAVEGRDDGRHVMVQLSSAGLTACTIDPDWAQQQDGVSISAALATALQRASAKRPASTPVGSRADDLIGDALATLISLTSSPLQGGNR